MLGLEDVRILEVARDRADRPLVGFTDLPAFGSAVTLVRRKRRWFCPEPVCSVESFTEDRSDTAPARAVMTTRAGLWATREVGAEIHTVSYAARQPGVCWHTVMDTVTYGAQALIEDPNRIADTAAVGLDETKMNAAKGRLASGLARTLNQWREPILAWHRHGHTNGPVEALNSLIKKVERAAAGSTNFDNYRTLILLAVGGSVWDLLGTPPR